MVNIVTIKYGFTYNGNTYGWYKKQLHKLPNNKPFKMQLNGSTKGYYISRRFVSMKTLKQLTSQINGQLMVKSELPF